MRFEIRRTDFIPLGLPDIHFVLAACALACLGFLLVASSSIEVASDRFGQPLSFAFKHAVFLSIASIAGVVAYLIPTRCWYNYATYFLFASIHTKQFICFFSVLIKTSHFIYFIVVY